MTCPTLPIGADAGLADTLVSLDCQVNGVVAHGYQRLFGAGGALTAVLTSLLTIYVLLIGYSLLTGRMRLSLPNLTPKVATLALVLTFATAWPAYQTVVYGLLVGGPDQIATAIMGGNQSAAVGFASRLDRLFGAMVDMSQAVSSAGDANSEPVKLASRLVWTSAITTLLSTVGVLVVSRLVLAILLALGPVFVVLGLFKATRGLFQGWIKASAAFALAPMLVVLGGAGLISVLEPMTADIARNPAQAVAEPGAIITLFVCAMVYAALLATLAFVAIFIARSWRMGGADVEAPRPDTIVDVAALATASGVRGSLDATAADPRVATLVASLSASSSATGTVSQDALITAAAAANDAAPPDAVSQGRARGLGQSFRPVKGARPISERIGA